MALTIPKKHKTHIFLVVSPQQSFLLILTSEIEGHSLPTFRDFE